MIKKYSKYVKYQKINEAINLSGIKIIPEGSSIPTHGVVKFGIDPTNQAGLHLGHLLPILICKKLKDAGCDLHIVVGTATAQFGDPSGRNAMRPMLSLDQTKLNATPILDQVYRIIGNDISVHYNHEWFNDMTFTELMNILSKFTVDYLMSRDAFQKRKDSGSNIGMHELIVPILQGLDSVKLNAGIEIGGKDQEFNFLLSRDVQSKMGQTPEICIMSPIINGTDGRKMSKSFNNCIFLNDTPKDVFGKCLSISDEVMHQWYPLFTDSYDPKTHPMELKKSLGVIITDIIWPGKGAEERKAFENVTGGALPTDIKSFPLLPILDFVVAISKVSKSDVRRLLQQGGVSVSKGGEGEMQKVDMSYQLEPGDVVKAGKRNYGRVE